MKVGGVPIPTPNESMLNYMKAQQEQVVSEKIRDATSHPADNLERLQKSTPTMSEAGRVWRA